MSKVAKKFHLDPDGYLTTKPDRELTTEEEATDAAEAAIGEALEEGGAIAEAIAASSGGEIKQFCANLTGAVSESSTNNATLSYADSGYVGSPYDKLFDMISLQPNSSYPYGHAVLDYSIIMVVINPYGGGGPNPSSVFHPCYATENQIWFRGDISGSDTYIIVNKSGTVSVQTVPSN